MEKQPVEIHNLNLRLCYNCMHDQHCHYYIRIKIRLTSGIMVGVTCEVGASGPSRADPSISAVDPSLIAAVDPSSISAADPSISATTS